MTPNSADSKNRPGFSLYRPGPGECGYRPYHRAELCLKPVVYAFTLKWFGKSHPTIKTCAEHAAHVRTWPSLDKMWSL